jgi:hypothetical protein
VRRVLLAILVLALTAIPAAAFVKPVTKRGDLDGDGDSEVVRAVRVDLKGVEDMFDRTKVTVTDTCKGADRTRNVAGPQDNLAFLRLKAIDGRKGREVYTQLFSGASARQGEARVVGWRRGSDGCSKPRKLFVYRSTNPTAAPRGSNGEVAGFTVRLRNATRRFKGTEIILSERFSKKGDPLCCGTYRKTTAWGYDRSRDLYRVYKTRVRKVKPTA